LLESCGLLESLGLDESCGVLESSGPGLSFWKPVSDEELSAPTVLSAMDVESVPVSLPPPASMPDLALSDSPPSLPGPMPTVAVPPQAIRSSIPPTSSRLPRLALACALIVTSRTLRLKRPV
jgi:hypothetical protein